MQTLFKALGRLGLALTILPSILYLSGIINLDSVKGVMIIGAVLWLVAAPLVQKFNKEITKVE
jgi:hypothetical protein